MKIQITYILILFFGVLNAQTNDSLIIRKFFDASLESDHCYGNLKYLCKEIGHRLSGSPQAQEAVNWSKTKMEELGLDNVHLQEVMVTNWKRGSREEGKIINSYLVGNKPLNISSLGGSVGTPRNGLTAEVVVVNSFEELRQLGEEKVNGKIVLFNEPMDAKLIDTFKAYGGCYQYRWSGAKEAAKLGAVAVLVRSLTHLTDEVPHTGSVGYDEFITKIPAAAVSTDDANALSQVVKKEGKCTVMLMMSCRSLPDVLSHNVIGEIKGTEQPDSVILIGAHLDSWDVGEGAHDDGAGVVQCLEVMRLLKESDYQPKYTIRCVLFMNEENGNSGGKVYADSTEQFHVLALESDRGGFSPRGFSIDASLEEYYQQIALHKGLLEPYGLHQFKKGYAGVDISPLKEKQDTITLVGLMPDSQRYFDYHHSKKDVFETVNKRELALGAASMASLVWLVDQYFQLK